MRLRTGLKKIPVALLLAVLLSCSSPTDPNHDLAAARTRWAERGPISYQIRVERICECLPEMSGPVLVAVEHGAVMARIYERTGGPVPPPYAALFPSVESLFASIETAGQQGTPVEVRYDPILGYPVRVALGRPLPDRPMTSVTVLETR